MTNPGPVGATGRADSLALALFAFAATVMVFLIGPAYLRGQVGSTPGFTGQEAIDLLTPILAMPLLALALELTGRSSIRSRVLFIALVAAWAAGQGIHLASNAIGDLFTAGSERDAFYATPAGALDHFLDELLSHWLWHLAWAGLLIILFWAGLRGGASGPPGGQRALAIAGAAGLLHGFTWFVVTAEGETWLLAIPLSIALLIGASYTRPIDGPGRVMRSFLGLGSLATVVLYAVWIGIAGWPPASLVSYFG